MTTIYHAIVQPDGKIEIETPELTPGQQVTITVTPEVDAHREAPTAGSDTQQAETADALFERMRGKSVREIVAMLPGHQLFKTAEEVDAYIREERDSWGD